MSATRDLGSGQRVRVKICGITRIEDARAAAEAGADAIGLVFYKDSPRAVTVEQARAILAVLPPFTNSIGLFVDASKEYIESVLQECPLDLLQFHGQESRQQCAMYSRPYIKALRVQDANQILSQVGEFPDARAILLDTYSKDMAGGTGQTFDWSLIPKNIDKPVILAGGLKPDNVRSAILQVRPYAVDVSGGVEAAKGIKDPDKIRSFINEVNNAINR